MMCLQSSGFQWFNVLVILANTGVMAATSYPIEPKWDYINGFINYGFTAYFTLEMLLKWAALGPVSYFRKRINQFDALVVAASLAELIVDLLPGSTSECSHQLLVSRLGGAVVRHQAGLWFVLPANEARLRHVCWKSGDGSMPSCLVAATH